MSATQVLVEEHEGIRLMLRILGKVCDRLEAGEAIDADHLAQIVEFLQVFADQCHHAKEEELLFPAMEAAGVPREQGPIGVMLYEHTLGRGYVSSMAETLAAYRAGEEAQAAAFASHARNYIALLTQHIEKENNILFPMADRTLSEQIQARLVEQFDDVERERIGPGRHEAFHEMMSDLEAVYLA